eukprot:SAG11_NODE_32863_length_280_cov_0.856354_1_plen_83_part_10
MRRSTGGVPENRPHGETARLFTRGGLPPRVKAVVLRSLLDDPHLPQEVGRPFEHCVPADPQHARLTSASHAWKVSSLVHWLGS